MGVIGVLAYLLLNPQKAQDEPTVVEDTVRGGRGTVATPENIDEIMAKRSEPIEDGYFETSMNVEWNFPNGKSESTNAYVANAPDNIRKIYFDVVLKDTNELIYSSPFIPVGSFIKGFALDKELSKGTYIAECQYHLVDDNDEEVSNFNVNVTITVEE